MTFEAKNKFQNLKTGFVFFKNIQNILSKHSSEGYMPLHAPRNTKIFIKTSILKDTDPYTRVHTRIVL